MALVLACGQAFAQPPVWTVHGRHGTLVLFGSVHLLPPGLDWRPAELTSALAHADELWFELPIDDAADAQAARLALARGELAPDDSLLRHLDPALGERLRQTDLALGLSSAFMERMRPWLAEMTLSLVVDMKGGARADQGVERQLQTLTPLTVRRRALETPAQQIGFLAGAPMADQVASLDQSLTEIHDKPDAYHQLVSDWMAGDLSALRAEALTPLLIASPALYRRLMTDRNRRWAGVLQRRLAKGGMIVVVVGMGHLIGPGGVPALLRAKGLAVEGP
ncbi:MAG TPA: TraB/GumN family protein [Caulobacteraceae bacterium]